MMFPLLSLTRAYICARFFYGGLEVKQNQTSHFFAALTLLNELLMIIEQQTIGFIFIFAAKIKKMQKMRTLF